MAFSSSININFNVGGTSPLNPGTLTLSGSPAPNYILTGPPVAASLSWSSNVWYIEINDDGTPYNFKVDGSSSSIPATGWVDIPTLNPVFISVVDTPVATPTVTPTVTPTGTRAPAPSPTTTPTVTPTIAGAPAPSPSAPAPSSTPTPTPTPTVTPVFTSVAAIISAFPELELSLTLNPAGSAEMLDPEIRAQEIVYADRAREGEFGYNVRRRLYHMGYNV